MSARDRVMFVYLGRRGLTQFTLEAGRAAISDAKLSVSVVVSRQNEGFAEFAELGSALCPVDTFATNTGAITRAWRLPKARNCLARRLASDQTSLVIDLMPHVWSPVLLHPIVAAAGARYVPIVHDATSHPGDYRSRSVQGLTQRCIRAADHVITLSASVADSLIAAGRVPREQVTTLFHPDLSYVTSPVRSLPAPGDPLRLLFFGRIMPYKGLTLFLDTVDTLRTRGIAVEPWIWGEGMLGTDADRVSAPAPHPAKVINRWLTDSEIADALTSCHVMVLAHTEASQSGVAATALGAGLPVVTTPVGGLTEQIEHGVTGRIAADVTADALADAVGDLVRTAAGYRAVCANIARARTKRSMAEFVSACVAAGR